MIWNKQDLYQIKWTKRFSSDWPNSSLKRFKSFVSTSCVCVGLKGVSQRLTTCKSPTIESRPHCTRTEWPASRSIHPATFSRWKSSVARNNPAKIPAEFRQDSSKIARKFPGNCCSSQRKVRWPVLNFRTKSIVFVTLMDKFDWKDV